MCSPEKERKKKSISSKWNKWNYSKDGSCVHESKIRFLLNELKLPCWRPFHSKRDSEEEASPGVRSLRSRAPPSDISGRLTPNVLLNVTKSPKNGENAPHAHASESWPLFICFLHCSSALLKTSYKMPDGKPHVPRPDKANKRSKVNVRTENFPLSSLSDCCQVQLE